MARAHWVASSRTPHRCHAGHVIEPPEGYYWAAPGFRSRKKFACKLHAFKASQLTTSVRGEMLAEQEDFDDELGKLNADQGTDVLDTLRELVEGFAEAARQYADERREGAEAWENGNADLEEKADNAEEQADELENFEVEEWSGDEEALNWDEPEPDEEEGDERDEWEAAKADHEEAESDLLSHIESQIEAASDLSSGLDWS